jgi:hypothetical protein
MVGNDKGYLKYGQIASRNCLILEIRELYQKEGFILRNESMILELLPYKNYQLLYES